MSTHSSETFAIEGRRPVISRDIRKDDRFEVPAFMQRAGVVALANVPILLPGGHPFGLLQVDATEPRDFDLDDVDFLRTYATVLGPVIDRLLTLRNLRSSEERFRLVVEEARDYAIFMTDPRDRITDWFPGAAEVFGWTREEAIGRPSTILFTPEDIAAGIDRQEIETASREGVAPNVRWHVCKDGARVFVEGSVRALRAPGGAVSGFLKIGHDVTERRQLQERQQVLLAELQHRTRNLMAVVRSIGEQTLRNSRDLADFGPRFRERMAALARVQGLLSRLVEGQRVTFGELVDSELSALAGRDLLNARVVLDGPHDVELRSSAVQTLALAIHELCTNALKYGALGPGGGRLSIRWQLSDEEGEPWFHLDWHESGVAMPPRGAPPQGSGAGRELIERALPYQLHARTTFVMGNDGVRCTIALPAFKRDVPEEDAHG